MKARNPTISIQIPEPCSQPWDEMTPAVGGRHCASCAKTVTDFTRMSDAQILEVLRNSAGGCGRFREDQVNRALVNPPVEKRFSLNGFYKVAASLLLVFSAGKVAAQERKEIPTQEILLKASQSMPNSISGVVTDNTGEPLPGAQIEVEDFQIVHIAGIDGEFEMDIPDSAFKNGTVRITVSFIGYKEEERIFSTSDFPLKLEVNLAYGKNNLRKKGGFKILPNTSLETRTLLTEEEIERMAVRKFSSFIGTINVIPTHELRNKERELQYKQQEGRLEEFIQDYGH